MPSKKQKIKIVVSICLLVILALQINKRNTQLNLLKQKEQAIINANSKYAKLLGQRSIYRDSVYKIYIANINDTNKIIFLKEGDLTSIRRKSKFFVHVYPVNKDLLNSVSNHIPLNFESNFQSIVFDGKTYHFASQNLPEFQISKLNLGQYGFEGDNQINWKIRDLLLESEIAFILNENDEEMSIFKPNLDNF